jgi:serine/threonine protein kinase
MTPANEQLAGHIREATDRAYADLIDAVGPGAAAEAWAMLVTETGADVYLEVDWLDSTRLIALGEVTAAAGLGFIGPERRLPADLLELYWDVAGAAILRKLHHGLGYAEPSYQFMFEGFETRAVVTGGMGMVIEAFDPELVRKVAIKLWSQDGPEAQAALLAEAKTLARLTHPNVVTIYATARWRERVYFVMEWIEGTDGHGWLQQPRTWQEVREVFLAAGEGLAAAHDAGIQHRDFKPGNMLIGNDGRVVVADFGLADSLATAVPVPAPPEPVDAVAGDEADDAFEDLDLPVDAGAGDEADDALEDVAAKVARLVIDAAGTDDEAFEDVARRIAHLLVDGAAPELGDAVGSAGPQRPVRVVGTRCYVAPERVRLQPGDGRSDQFSFCVALWEALHGQRPYAGHSIADVLESIERGEIQNGPRTRHVPHWLSRVVRKGLAEDPDQRFASMRELLQALRDEPPDYEESDAEIDAPAGGPTWRTLLGATVLGGLLMGAVEYGRALERSSADRSIAETELRPTESSSAAEMPCVLSEYDPTPVDPVVLEVCAMIRRDDFEGANERWLAVYEERLQAGLEVGGDTLIVARTFDAHAKALQDESAAAEAADLARHWAGQAAVALPKSDTRQVEAVQLASPVNPDRSR